MDKLIEMSTSNSVRRGEDRFGTEQSYADFQRHNNEHGRREERGLDKYKK